MQAVYQMSQLTVLITAVLSLLLAAGGAVLWRRDRLVLGVFAGAFVAMLLGALMGEWDQAASFAVFYLESCVAGMLAYSLLRWKVLGFGPPGALAAGVANSLLAPLSLHILGLSTMRERGEWVLYLIPWAALTAVAVALAALLVRAVVRSGAAMDAVPGEGPAPAQEDRRTVMRMLAEGRLSSEEAAQLIEALGGAGTPGDRLPLSGPALASLAAGIAIALGFVLPWARVRIGGMQGYQAGTDVGFLGWLILLLGLLPALLACVPALDACLRQAMLRLLLACTGLAFAVSLAARLFGGRNVPGIGLILILLGFGVQFFSALAGMGLLRRSSARATG